MAADNNNWHRINALTQPVRSHEPIELPFHDDWIDTDAVRYLVSFLHGVFPHLTDINDLIRCDILYFVLLSHLELAQLDICDITFVKYLLKMFDDRTSCEELFADTNTLDWSFNPLDDIAYWELREAMDAYEARATLSSFTC